MTPTIRLGRLFGIEVGLNWSLLFVVVLIAWTLARATLPQETPGQPLLSYWIAGLAGAALFCASLLAHELAHAVVARSRGVRVAGITLWLFGGVSRLQGEPGSPGAEALITAVGPLTSIVVAVAAFLLGVAAQLVGAPALVWDLLSWLALLNLALAVFNLLPAFPLDGGRLLSTFFWWRRGTRQRGVHAAVQVGRLLAVAMIVVGLLQVILGSPINGIWIAFVGWFLLMAASAEESSAAARAALRLLPVSAAMSAPVVTVPEWLSVEEFLGSTALQYRFTTFPLHTASGTLSGVARLPELLRVPAHERGRTALRDRAHPMSQIPTATPDEDLAHLVDRLGPAIEQRVLVFDRGQLVGILSPADIARVLTLRGPQR